ncbi:MAG: hypothetical protein NZ606_00385 [Candidatus Kapabacteria bacterium]|nr:hypothetical protein [Candidatus Kapabacteria bacterium]
MSVDPLSTEITPVIIERAPLFEQEGPRSVAIRSLLRIDTAAVDAEHVVRGELIAHPHWDQFEQALYQELVYGTLRWRAKLDWILTGFYHGEFPKCMPAIQHALRVALYQILMISKVPPMVAIDSSVRIIERLKGSSSAATLATVLRSIARNVAGIRYPPREQAALHFSVVHSHPLWLVQRWIARWGEEVAEQMLAANLERPPLYLAVNRVCATEDQFQQWLQSNAHPFERSPITARVYRLNPFTDYSALPPWQQGWCYPTDPMWTVAAELVESIRPTDVLYASSAPTKALLPLGDAVAESKAHLAVWCPTPSTAEWIEHQWQRYRWPLPEILNHDWEGSFDLVYADVPSSAIGLWRRRPELKWRSDSLDVRRAGIAARNMLANLVSSVRPGGYLLITVSSTEPEETTGLVDWLIGMRPDFRLVPISTERVAPSLVQSNGTVQSLPHLHRCDSVFIALCQRMP